MAANRHVRALTCTSPATLDALYALRYARPILPGLRRLLHSAIAFAAGVALNSVVGTFYAIVLAVALVVAAVFVDAVVHSKRTQAQHLL